MKKILASFFAVMMIMTVVVSLASCNDGVAKVKAYADEIEESMASEFAEFEAQGIKAEVEARGTELVYKYTYIVEIDPDAVAKELETLLPANFAEASYEAIKEECPEVTAVVFEYYAFDNDKNKNVVIYSTRS